ncbi:MAG: substrate-binding domain-containing protein, partial [Dehalococcoidia bacterium]
MIMRSYEVAGFCAMISGKPEERLRTVERLSGLEQPLIVFQEAIDSAYGDLCVVRQDDRGGGRLLADHLLARRVKSYLVIVPGQGWPAIEYRVAGLLEGLAMDPSVFVATVESASESFADVQDIVAAYLKNHPVPEAVVGTNDAIATAAMLYLIGKGHSVPDDLRVVGFNRFEAHRYSRPPLTTVQSVPYELGELAGHAMLNRLAGGRFDVREYVLPVVFVPSLTT